MQNNRSYFAILTANVRYDKRISFRQKVLFAEITALTHAKGHCFASNNYFAKLYDVQPETISRDISALKDAGYITVFIDKSSGNKRRIYASTGTEQSIPIDEEINRGINEEIKTTIDDTRKYNNTSINNTSVNSGNAHTHENSNTLKDNSKTPLIPAAPPSFEDVDYIEVAKDMADYFENDERGKTEWQWMCSTKRVKVKPLAITSQWAAKHQDAPYMLQNWRKHTGKLINWIREQSDTSKHTGTNQPATTYEAPRTAHRTTKRKKISKEELAEIQKLAQNAKFSK